MDNHLPFLEQVHPQNEFIEFRREEIEQSIATRFEAQVARYPQRLALRAGESHFTYQTLNRAVNRLAHALLKRRGEAAEPVALLLEQGAAPVVAIMGVAKAGKFYVPLDPSYPLARAVWNSFIGGMFDDITKQRFDCVLANSWDLNGIFTANPPPGSERDGLSTFQQFYTLRTVSVTMPARPRGGSWPMQVWVPKDRPDACGP